MKTIDEFAEQLSDAYSTNTYKGGWKPSIKMLRQRGYTDAEIEAIIRSKWTRWAGDGSDHRHGHVTSADLARFLDDPRNRCKEQLPALVAETFPRPTGGVKRR